MAVESPAGIGGSDEGAGAERCSRSRIRSRISCSGLLHHRGGGCGDGIVLPTKNVVHGNARPGGEGAGLGEEGEAPPLDGECHPGPEEVAEAKVVGTEGGGRDRQVLFDARLGTGDDGIVVGVGIGIRIGRLRMRVNIRGRGGQISSFDIAGICKGIIVVSHSRMCLHRRLQAQVHVHIVVVPMPMSMSMSMSMSISMSMQAERSRNGIGNPHLLQSSRHHTAAAHDGACACTCTCTCICHGSRRW